MQKQQPKPIMYYKLYRCTSCAATVRDTFGQGLIIHFPPKECVVCKSKMSCIEEGVLIGKEEQKQSDTMVDQIVRVFRIHNIPKAKSLQALRLLRHFVNVCDTPCRFDHHGNCQEHFNDPKPCPVEQAKQLLKEFDL